MTMDDVVGRQDLRLLQKQQDRIKTKKDWHPKQFNNGLTLQKWYCTEYQFTNMFKIMFKLDISESSKENPS